MGDWDWVVAQIAAEPPWFNEDTVCYHAHTFGFILGELIRRVTGKSLLDFLNEELIEPLDADFHLVLSDEKVRTRSFRMLNLKPQFDGENILGDQVFSSFDVPLHSDAWYAISQKAVVPSGGGFSCASGLNKIATMMAQKGTYRGKRYLSEVIVEEASSLQFSGVDPMLGEINLGLGFGLDGAAFPAPTQDSFHWGGYGGSWCFADHKRKLAGAYVTNHCIVNNFAAGTFDMRLVGFFGLMRTTFS
jgi:CubicO group peptidase (beta-lactamase class C family)